MPLWAVHGSGRPIAGGAVGPGERLTWPQTAGHGVQHVLAVAGAMLLVPVLTGFPVSVTLLFAGLGTLFFLLLTRNQLPAFVGPSIAFLAPLQAAKGAGFAAQLGGVLVVGLVLTAVGVAVKALGPRVVELLMPPVVTGAVVMLVGLSLLPAAFESIGAQPAVAVVTVLAMVLGMVLLPGLAGRLSVLLGVLVGWLVAELAGGLDPDRLDALRSAAWFGLPELTGPQIRPSVVLAMLPLVIVLIVENIGQLKAIGAVTGHNVDGYAGNVLIANGVATTLAGLGGAPGASTRPENIGVMAASRVYSTAAYVAAALAVIGLSASPKFAALVLTVPVGVVGGVGLVLAGLIGVAGGRIWLDSRVELTDPTTLLVAMITLIAGLGGLTLTIGDVSFGGLTLGAIGIVVVYPVLRALRRSTAEPLRSPRRRGRGPGWQVEQK